KAVSACARNPPTTEAMLPRAEAICGSTGWITLKMAPRGEKDFANSKTWPTSGPTASISFEKPGPAAEVKEDNTFPPVLAKLEIVLLAPFHAFEKTGPTTSVILLIPEEILSMKPGMPAATLEITGVIFSIKGSMTRPTDSTTLSLAI